MNIDISAVVSVLVGLATIYTFIHTSAKNQEHTNGKIDVLETKLQNNADDIKELKNEVHKYNQLKDRMAEVESNVKVLDEKQDVANHRISDCETAIEKNRDKLINFTRR